MGRESMSGDPAAEAAAKHEAKMERGRLEEAQEGAIDSGRPSAEAISSAAGHFVESIRSPVRILESLERSKGFLSELAANEQNPEPPGGEHGLYSMRPMNKRERLLSKGTSRNENIRNFDKDVLGDYKGYTADDLQTLIDEVADLYKQRGTELFWDRSRS